jgi:hypothetical protein
VELIDILGNNKGDDNRVNREETVTMVNKAKDLESGPGKLCTTISRHAAQQKIEKNYHGQLDQTALNLLGHAINRSSRRRSESLKPYKTPHSRFYIQLLNITL